MAKYLTLGNGHILINLDEHAQVRDFYFPRVGLENHIGDRLTHRVGAWVAGELRWFDQSDWQIRVDCENDVMVGRTEAVCQKLNLRLLISDLVYNEKNIFLRRITVKNLSAERRLIKIFFAHQFEMYESHIAHTAYYDPLNRVIIHYRNQRAFVVNAQLDGRGFDDFTTGVFGLGGKEGSHLDARDGRLAQNPVEHGPADSVIGLSEDYAPDEENIIHYWIAAGKSIAEATDLNHYVLSRGVNHIMETTANFWRAWVHRRNFSFYGLEPPVIELFNKSLLYLRAHADQNGGIIASGDSKRYLQEELAKDTYAYVWPRDAAYAAIALARSGDVNVAKRFFIFCHQVLGDGEYFMHKYSPDKSLGSSWHPWWKNGQVQLPIQEDETALVLYALGKYYEVSKDLEFIESLYNSLIKRTADFMVLYRDASTGLPKPSYNLWEEKYGISTFTASTVYAALLVAARFAKILGKVKNEQTYYKTAQDLRQAILTHLYDPRRQIFYNLLYLTPEGLVPDLVIDISSVYGVVNFGVLPADDQRVLAAWRQTEQALTCPGAIGGLARYEGDIYYQTDVNCPNPWFTTSLWRAQHLIELAKQESDLAPVREWLRWAERYALPSGILSEQLHPRTGQQLSVAPLVWSHAELVNTVINYLDKLEALGVCTTCNPVY